MTIKKTMNLFSLIMVSAALTVSVRNFPTEAETGMHMIFFALFAAVFFFIPVALVAAELATGWPEQGGIYAWVKAAFGERLGFIGIWLQWSYMIIGIISMLYFVGGSLAYVFAPGLAHNRLFLMSILLIVLWGATFFSLRGQKVSSLISSIGFLSGVLFPGLLIIILGAIYLLLGNAPQLKMTISFKDIIPSLKSFSTIVLLVGFMRAFSGVEVSASHAGEVEKPKTNYPIAIFVVVLLGLILNILGALSVAVVVPQKQISLVSGLMAAYSDFLSKFHMTWFTPIMGILITLGAIGGISSWIMGPVKGVFEVGKSGALPGLLQKSNKNGAPASLLILQAIVVSIVGCGLLLMPNLNIAFWTSVAIAMLVYFAMYALMFLSALRLRYTAANVHRDYKVPGGKFGMWTVCCMGLFSLFLGAIVAFFPPAQLPTGNVALYEIVLILSTIIILVIPFIIDYFKSPKWKQN